MRYALVVLVVVPLAVGCAESCPAAPESLNSQAWTIDNQIVEILDAEPLSPDFPRNTPADGEHQMVILWQGGENSPVQVTLDGQAFVGEGVWDSTNCGNFLLGFHGDYVAENGAIHSFQASGPMETWPGYLQGEWQFREVWTTAAGNGSGENTFRVQVFGTN